MAARIGHLAGWAFLAAFLAGCGGGSGSPQDPAGEQPPGDGSSLLEAGPAGGTVALPPGLGLAPEGLRVRTAVGEYPVDTEGGWSGGAWAGAPSFARVLGQDGRTVLVGWTGDGEDDFSARSTAAALLYFHLLAFSFSFEDQAKALALVQGEDATLDALAAAIEEAYAGGAADLDEVTVQIQERLRAAVTSYRERFETLGTVVQPTGGKSGVEIVQGDPEQILAINHYRRRTTVFVQRMRYLEADGETWTSAGEAAKSYDVGPTTGLGSLLSTIWAAISGEALYAPVTSSPMPTPLVPADAKRVEYEVRVVGAGLSKGEAWDSLGEEEKARVVFLWTRTAIGDILIPLLANTILPLKGNTAAVFESDKVANALTSFMQLANEAFDAEIRQKIESGTPGEILSALVKPLLEDPRWKEAIEDIFVQIIQDAGAQVVEEWQSDLTFPAFNLAAIDAGFTAIDTIVQTTHVAVSNMAEKWTVDVLPGTVHLTPERGSILLGDELPDFVSFEAVVQDFPSGDPSLRYVWSTSGRFGTLSDTDDHLGTSYESLQMISNYTAGSTTQGGEDDVTVEVFREVGGKRIFVGKAQAIVTTIGTGPIFRPRRAALRPGASQRFHVGFPGLPAGAVPSQTDLRYAYDWSSALGYVSDVRGTPVVPGEPTQRIGYVDYRALDNAPDGARDTLSVEVFVVTEDGTTSLGTAEAQIRIELEPSLIEGALRVHVFPSDDGERVGVYADIVWPARAGATRYVMTGYGGYDWATNNYGPIVANVQADHLTHDHADKIPAGQIWQALAAVWGGVEGGADSVNYMKSRFGNTWTWEIEIFE